MRLVEYTDQQARMERAFSYGGSCCDTYCEACGRTYFVTSNGHGDYEQGELDSLRKKATEQPDKYIEVPDFGSVATMCRPTDGKQVVVGCLCDPTKQLSDWIESHAESLTTYLQEYWKAVHAEAERNMQEARDAILALGWQPMDTAPKDETWIEVTTKDGQECQAHWASDLSGEEQPPFQGWFTRRGIGPFRQVHPIQWRPVKVEAAHAHD